MHKDVLVLALVLRRVLLVLQQRGDEVKEAGRRLNAGDGPVVLHHVANHGQGHLLPGLEAQKAQQGRIVLHLEHTQAERFQGRGEEIHDSVAGIARQLLANTAAYLLEVLGHELGCRAQDNVHIVDLVWVQGDSELQEGSLDLQRGSDVHCRWSCSRGGSLRVQGALQNLLQVRAEEAEDVDASQIDRGLLAVRHVVCKTVHECYHDGLHVHCGRSLCVRREHLL
mmetsp:Transcript_85326/g.182869  ORF Transcript_85326/g.182869 Transcript_85326/m.182869 type:complete len:225 (+) Transcript_85326:616-1290(+)